MLKFLLLPIVCSRRVAQVGLIVAGRLARSGHLRTADKSDSQSSGLSRVRFSRLRRCKYPNLVNIKNSSCADIMLTDRSGKFGKLWS